MRSSLLLAISILSTAAVAFPGATVAQAEEPILIPTLVGAPWTIASNPDLGEYTSAEQQPVDFAIWQAGDGSWQLWSCIRQTKIGGNTRLFYRWESAKLTDKDWKPMGIAMRADAKLGETEGGLQAPYVVHEPDRYLMFYGDWERICLAESKDGKTFTRQKNSAGEPALFARTAEMFQTRDPMALKIGNLWYLYYCSHPGNLGADYCRTSPDLKTWSEAKKVAAGGEAGAGPGSAECPFVARRGEHEYYLFRTQHYGSKAATRVYRSNDPLDFGIDDDQRLVATFPIAAPELIQNAGEEYVAYLLPNLKGIQISRLVWKPRQAN